MIGAIGIDIAVAKPCTIAWKGADGWYCFAYMPSDWHGIELRLSTLKGAGRRTHAAIEKPYVGANRKDSMDLSRVYGRVEVLCEQAGLVVIPAPPSIWQAEMLTPRGGKLGDSANRKRLSMLVAKDGLGGDPANDDESDAMCIAAWGTKQARLKALEREGT